MVASCRAFGPCLRRAIPRLHGYVTAGRCVGRPRPCAARLGYTTSTHRARDLRYLRHRRCPHANKFLINIARGCHLAGACTMTNVQPDTPLPAASRLRPRAFLLREWPYLLMLLLALFGVAYTSFSHAPMATYWIALAPFIGLMCVVT